MKAPAEAGRLPKHRPQALRYWAEAADDAAGVPSPQYVVLCAFRRLEIWEPGRFPKAPRAALDLIDLPDQYDALLFLAGGQPVFLGGQAAITRQAVGELTDLYAALRERKAAPLDVLRDFLLQLVWCMFAEDLGQIPGHRFSQIVDGLLGDPRRSSADDLGQLFHWFRKAHDHLEPGGRAGLVGTNSISQNRARGASLDYIASRGGVITEAVSRQKWPGEAVVNVSIVNWVKQPPAAPERFLLDGAEVSGISTALRESVEAIEAVSQLAPNRGRSFQGPIPVGDFYLAPEEARAILGTDPKYAEVVRPYLVGDDITEDPGQRPRRFVIDFAERTLEEAMLYPHALELVRARVKPQRDANSDEGFRRLWWRFGRPRPAMRAAIDGLDRYIAGNRIGKRFLFCWADPATCPSDLTIVFAFDDDYAMGVLTSGVHVAWALRHSSTLEDRPRYTPTTAFETFPWPPARAAQRARIGAIAAELLGRRQEICREREIGLTTLYNQVDDGAWTDLRALHLQLDDAVGDGYDWEAGAARKPLESNARLLQLNASIARGELSYDPFG